MNKYRKFIVALVGVAVNIAIATYGISDPTVHAVVDLVTALGVYGVKNG